MEWSSGFVLRRSQAGIELPRSRNSKVLQLHLNAVPLANVMFDVEIRPLFVLIQPPFEEANLKFGTEEAREPRLESSFSLKSRGSSPLSH